jgi:ataxin-10
LLETLRLLDLFLPRIYFGKPVPSSAAAPTQSMAPKVDPTGFLYVKRDLVRLLGALAHESRGVQDRTRNANGIPVVMNLCVIDERNPCTSDVLHLRVATTGKFVNRSNQLCSPFPVLREHALFTLHNLLKNNPENQAIVDAIRPAAELDDAGVLKNKLGALKIK